MRHRNLPFVCVVSLLTGCAVTPADQTPPTTTIDPAASLGLDPSDAFGPPTATLPGGATIISVDAARARFQQGKPDFISAKKTQSVADAAAAQVKIDEQTLSDYVAAHPEVEAFVDADPMLDSRSRLRADGNIDFDALKNDGTTATYITMGRENRRQLLAQVIRSGGTRANREAAEGPSCRRSR